MSDDANNVVSMETFASRRREAQSDQTEDALRELYGSAEPGGEPGLLQRNPDEPIQGLDIRRLNSEIIAAGMTRMLCDHLFDYWGLDVERDPKSIYELCAIMEGIAQLIDRAGGLHDERHQMIEDDLSEYIDDPYEALQALMYPMFQDDDED